MPRKDHTKLKKEKQKKEPKDPQAVVKQTVRGGGRKKKPKTKEELIDERGVQAATSFDLAPIGGYFHFKSGETVPRNGKYFEKNGMDSYLDGRVQYQVRSRQMGVTLYELS